MFFLVRFVTTFASVVLIGIGALYFLGPKEGIETPTPIAVYLTWQHAPENSMTIHWISDAQNKDSHISYRELSENLWQKEEGRSETAPEGYDNYLIHTVELTDLSPDTVYEFKIDPQNTIYKLRTMPQELNREIRFIVGGDLYHDSIQVLKETHSQAAKQNPDFAILGGDIAYAAPKNENGVEDVSRWIEFFSAWGEDMVTSEGVLIPILPTTSNEDTKGRYNQTKLQAPCFYAFLSTTQGRGYRAVDFGDYLTVWLLDSGHTNPIDQSQAVWLEESLRERENISHKIAAYHVPAFPSYRPMDGKWSTKVRETWVPLFDRYGLHAAFEHHDHANKRTHPIKNGQIDPDGVIYLGDGGYGVSHPRVPAKPEDRWYLAHTSSKSHFYLVTLTDGMRTYRAIDPQGDVFDETEQVVKEIVFVQ